MKNRMVYSPEEKHQSFTDWKVWAYLRKDGKIVVQWDVFDRSTLGWLMSYDHVCEDLSHAAAVWETRWLS